MADSTIKTTTHILEVQKNIDAMRLNLIQRANRHDLSKLEDFEKPYFDRIEDLEQGLDDVEYGSAEYKRRIKEHLAEALPHHYAVNDHHPEHFPPMSDHPGGYAKMNLMQRMEMLADWYAATKRMKNGDLATSIDINVDRFNLSYDDRDCLISTAKELGWLQD